MYVFDKEFAKAVVFWVASDIFFEAFGIPNQYSKFSRIVSILNIAHFRHYQINL